MTKHPFRLSTEARAALKKIVEKEIPQSMADGEIEEMGTRLLWLFDVLTKPMPTAPLIQVTPEEYKALKFIHEEVEHHGRNPSARILAKELGYKSSRSGLKSLNALIAKGWVFRGPDGKMRMEMVPEGCACSQLA